MSLDNLYNRFVIKKYISNDIIFEEMDFDNEDDALNTYYAFLATLEKNNINNISKVIVEKKCFLVESTMLKHSYYEVKDKSLIIKEKNIK